MVSISKYEAIIKTMYSKTFLCEGHPNNPLRINILMIKPRVFVKNNLLINPSKSVLVYALHSLEYVLALPDFGCSCQTCYIMV